MNKKRKLRRFIFLLAMSFFLVPSIGFAAPENFGGLGKAWKVSDPGQYFNINNLLSYKDWLSKKFIVPGKGGIHANHNSAVKQTSLGTLVNNKSK